MRRVESYPLLIESISLYCRWTWYH